MQIYILSRIILLNISNLAAKIFDQFQKLVKSAGSLDYFLVKNVFYSAIFN